MVDETVVIVTPATSTPSAPSATSPEITPEVVEVIHDDARDLGYALARIDQLALDNVELTGRVVALEAVASAQTTATAAIVEAVEETQETVEEIASEVVDSETFDTIEGSAPEPEPDTTPGKAHWLRRSAKEWRGRD